MASMQINFYLPPAYRLRADERTLVEAAKVTLHLPVFQINIDSFKIKTVLGGVGIPR